MNPKKDLKHFFEKILKVKVDIEGETPTTEELDKKNFIIFVDSYRQAIKRSKKVDDKYNLNLWDWDNLFAQSLEGLIFFTFDEVVAEVILWFIYEHDLAEDENDWIVSDPEGDPHKIETAEDLYNFILHLEKF
jgi:hypothetical protein